MAAVNKSTGYAIAPLVSRTDEPGLRMGHGRQSFAILLDTQAHPLNDVDRLNIHDALAKSHRPNLEAVAIVATKGQRDKLEAVIRTARPDVRLASLPTDGAGQVPEADREKVLRGIAAGRIEVIGRYRDHEGLKGVLREFFDHHAVRDAARPTEAQQR